MICPCHGLLVDCRLCGGQGKLSPCVCGGLGYVAKPVALGRWEVEPCPRCGDDEVGKLGLPSGLAEEQESWTFDNLYRDLSPLAEVAARLETWARVDRRGWWVLAAPWGRGKTYLMAALVNHYRARSLEAMYWLESTMLQEMQDAAMDRSVGWTFGSIFRALVNVPLLCIDEFGHVGLTLRRGEWLRAVLVARSDGNWLPTVFATNVVAEKFATDLPWLWSRWGDEHTRIERFEGVPDLRGHFKEEKRTKL